MRDEIKLSPNDLGQPADRLGITSADLKLVDNGRVLVNVLVAGISVDPTPDNDNLKVTPPPGIGEGPWAIVVTTKTDKMLNILAYDLKKKKLYIPDDLIDDEDAAV